MNFDSLINAITPEIYARLKRAVELGKWDNGVPLTPEQREYNLQAIIAYDQKHKDPEERVGYIEPKASSGCNDEEGANGANNESDEKIVRVLDQ